MSLINQMLQDIENRKPGEHLPVDRALLIQASPVARSKTWSVVIALTIVGIGASLVWQRNHVMQLTPSNEFGNFNVDKKIAQFKSSETLRRNLDVIPNAAIASKISLKPTFDRSLDFYNAKESLKSVSLSNKSTDTSTFSTKQADINPANFKNALAQEIQSQTLTNVKISNPSNSAHSEFIQIQPEAELQTKLADAKLTSPKVSSETRVVFNKHLNPEQLALRDYQQALNYLQQGRVAEAQDLLKKSITNYPDLQDARQTLVGLLVDNNKTIEAIEVLKEGIALKPNQLNQIQTLAQLQMQLGMQDEALFTLQQGLTYASQNEDYHAFMAAVLQQKGQHQAAITHYQQALSSGKNNPTWLIGLGISLQAEGRNQEAKLIYQKIPRDRLSAELIAFVDQRLKQIQ